MKENFVCRGCGRRYNLEDCTVVGEDEYCPDCVDEETTICERCGVRILREDVYGEGHLDLCQSCYSAHYTTCDQCGRLIPNGEALYDEVDNPLCQECYNSCDEKHPIQDYYYKPAPIFYGEGHPYFGVEVELDCGGESNSKANQLLEIGNDSAEHIYCKHDGSLDDGFEIVTHPMTLDYHKTQMPWQAVLQRAAAMGYLSHQARTCGLHVHVCRTAFGESVPQQEERIARVLYFFEKHWEELLKFSRRTSRQLDRWAARYGYRHVPKEILDCAKAGGSGSRYTCINLQNPHTVEFRIFRGTLKHNTLLATIQLVNIICNLSTTTTDEDMASLPWTTFVSQIDKEIYPELVQYLKERRLYIGRYRRKENENGMVFRCWLRRHTDGACRNCL